jgi:uncharacterized membrane protein
MAFCASCGAQLPADGGNCPACGKAAGQSAGGGAGATPAATAGGLQDNVAGMLAYVTIIPAIIFLVVAPYNQNKFIRFHSFQSLFFGVAWIAISIVLSILAAMPFLGFLTLFIWPLVGLACLIIWVILLMKAYGGQKFKLPVIGDLAEKQANA